MKTGEKLSLCLLLLIVFAGSVAAQELITNVYGRNIHSLNGKWNAIIDLYDQGQRMKIYENRQPEGNIDFYEYAFEGGLRLNVPGDWNSQSPELKYYEGTVWYARHFDAKRLADKRQFLYFGAVSYRCKVYLNGKEIAEHEGGFTPFQVEVTDLLKDGDNFLAGEVNNRRRHTHHTPPYQRRHSRYGIRLVELWRHHKRCAVGENSPDIYRRLFYPTG